MKLIFISTDGVLSNQQYIGSLCNRVYNNLFEKDKFKAEEYLYNHQNQVDKSKISILNYLINKTKAGVVLMGQWRLHHSLDRLNDILRKNGATFEASGTTPYLYRYQDGRPSNHVNELESYLDSCYKKYNSPIQFIILDDRSDWGVHQNNLVKVNYERGLRHFDVEKCFDKFGISYKKI